MPEKSDDKWKRYIVNAAMLSIVANILILKSFKQAIFLKQVILYMIGKRLIFCRL